MKKLYLLILLLSNTLLPMKAYSDFISDGNQFLEQCQKFYAKCQGYMQGITDVIAVYNGWYDPKNCKFEMPNNVTDIQLVDLIIKYYKDNPEIRHHWNAYTIIQRLSEVFPCNKK